LAKPVFDRFPWSARVSVLILIGLVTAEHRLPKKSCSAAI